MFGTKLISKINLGKIDPDYIEMNDKDEIDFHQTILNIGYSWWKFNPNPNAVSYSDMIDYMDKTYCQIFGTLVLIGKLNQQVIDNGFIGYYNNNYSRKVTSDYGQSLHVRLVKSMIELIDELKEKDKIIDITGFIILNEALQIFKDYLKIPIELEKRIMEEVECGNEEDGFFFEMEEVENEEYGQICNSSNLDALNNRYYKLDEKFMEIMNIISKYCFETEEVPALNNEEMNQLLLEAVSEVEVDPDLEGMRLKASDGSIVIIRKGIIELDDGYKNTEMTISDRIDAMVDPEMNIEKVIEMICDTQDLAYTKGEGMLMIEKFIENFNKEYLIIKKG